MSTAVSLGCSNSGSASCPGGWSFRARVCAALRRCILASRLRWQGAHSATKFSGLQFCGSGSTWATVSVKRCDLHLPPSYNCDRHSSGSCPAKSATDSPLGRQGRPQVWQVHWAATRVAKEISPQLSGYNARCIGIARTYSGSPGVWSLRAWVSPANA